MAPKESVPLRLERWSFFGIVAACLLMVVLTFLETQMDGDDTPLHVLDALALLFIGVAATITRRAVRMQRQSEAATAQASAELYRFRAMESANLAKSRYLANVSHEIRSPLNAIYGYAQLVEHDDSVNPREAARVIRRCAEHLTSLVEGLLDISQMEHGVLRVRHEDVRFGQFLESIVSMMRPAATAKGLEFIYRPPTRMPDIVRMDSSRFRQVLINLLSNAIKFTDYGTVTLEVSYSGQIARFEIADTGPGIAHDELERIFEPFERGGDEAKWARPGAGLGLSIARTIVQILGGQLEVDSKVGQGTCFRVTMMLAEVSGKLESAVAAYKLAGYEGPQQRVLVVDDEAEHREWLERLLVSLGFQVHAASGGKAAIELAASQAFDLAILDISMPDMSGWETAVELRNRLGGDLRILMLSANAHEFHKPDFPTPVHDFFLCKPVEFGVLTDTIGGLLGLNWKREQPRQAAPAATSIHVGALGPDARLHVDRLGELLRIGYVRGIEAEIRGLSAIEDAEPLAARLFDCLDRYDLAGMRRVLEEA